MEPLVAMLAIAVAQCAVAVVHAIRLQLRSRQVLHEGILALPWPAGWEPASGAARVLLASVNVAIALFLLGGAAHSLRDGGGLTITAFFAALGLMLFVISTGVFVFGFPAHRGLVRTRLDTVEPTGEAAVVIEKASERSFLLWGGSALLVAGFVLVVVAASPSSALGVAMAVVAFGLALAVVGAAFRGYRDTELWLTPTGVVVVRGTSRSAVAWAAMHVVKAEEREQFRAPARRLVAVSASSVSNDYPQTLGVPAPTYGSIDIDPERMRCDPVLLVHCLGFYRRNAHLRAELGTARSVQRIERGQLTEIRTAPEPF